jgi:LuxR family transcriptional regulator, maltose regulon positive regulatory protein
VSVPSGRAGPARAPAERVPAAGLPFDVVESKIHLPVLPSGVVSRTALLNRLKATTSAPFVAMTAPAGYGKTTLLAQWAARDRRPFAWISVDAGDAEPIVLLRNIGAALHTVEPLEPHVLDALDAPGPSVWATALPRLGSALSASRPLVVVLDDAHLLRPDEPLELLRSLAEHLPQGSLLVLSGRATPLLPVAALRAAGMWVEIGIEQLALSPREGQLLLRSAGVALTFEEVSKVLAECEGWPAALALAALELRDDDDGRTGPSRPIEPVRRQQRIAAYIRSEYLERLRPRELRFLRMTSVLDQMCGRLCDAVVGTEGSARDLAKIERASLFLVPLDRQRVWYRYHRLFRDVLRRELAEREPDLVPVLHARAADWFEAYGDPESALEHVLAAGDVRRAARIVTAIALPTYDSGRVVAVERWLAPFDDPILLKRFPAVALVGAWIHTRRGRAADAERWLGLAERGLTGAKGFRGTAAQRAWISVIRAGLGRQGVHGLMADAESALAGLARDNPIRPTALTALAAGYMLLGQNEQADAVFAEAATEAARLGSTDTLVLALAERSILAARRDDAAEAERLAHEACELAENGGLSGYVTTAIARAASARAALRQGRWDEALDDLDRMRELSLAQSAGVVPWFAIQTRIEFARAYLALRETATVRALLGEIHELLREHPYVGVLAEEAAELEREAGAIPEAAAGAGLTAAELRLLPFLTTHLSFREIGERLYVSRNTIKTQAISVYRKLGVTSRSEAIECAAHLGLVEHPSKTC